MILNCRSRILIKSSAGKTGFIHCMFTLGSPHLKRDDCSYTIHVRKLHLTAAYNLDFAVYHIVYIKHTIFTESGPSKYLGLHYGAHYIFMHSYNTDPEFYCRLH